MEYIIKCPVCLETFDDPRVLPCQHSFCKKCVTGVAKARRGLVVCPQCRRESWLPRKGVKGYPSNIFIKNVIDILNNGSDASKRPINCSSCASNAIASHNCIYCNEKLCGECAMTHGQRLGNNVTDEVRRRHHVLVLPGDVIHDNADQEKYYRKCRTHPEEDLKYHCDKCQCKVCWDCTVLAHTGHNVQPLDDAVKEYRGLVKSLVSEARGCYSKLDPVLDKISHATNRVQSSCQACFGAIREAKERCLYEFCKQLDARESQLMRDLHKMSEDEEVRLKREQERIQNYLTHIERLATEIDESAHKINTDSLIEIKWKMKETVSELMQALKEIPTLTGRGDVELEFTEKSNAGDLLKQGIEGMIGTLRLTQRQGDHVERPLETATMSPSHVTGDGRIHETADSQGSGGQTGVTQGSVEADIPCDRPYRDTCTICGRTNHVARLCRARYDIYGRRVHPRDTCFRCGEEGHWAEDCLQSSTSENSWHTVGERGEAGVPGLVICRRCGRHSHNESACYATYAINGRRL
ncbi:transcription intermediary factor 1-beta [Nematostella vectensis]|uniref:transcription intermediary factor 1-beta n=1 Tax=Nematostella vectensis TaxID=45351 RepID=UPI0020771C8B|nr:transcription intermediary factor 1-beta [Nematostella vectensis]